MACRSHGVNLFQVVLRYKDSFSSMAKNAKKRDRKSPSKLSAKPAISKPRQKQCKNPVIMTFAEASKEYGLRASDLRYFGRPAREIIYNRKFEKDDLEYIALKKKSFQSDYKNEGAAKKQAVKAAKVKQRDDENQSALEILKLWQKKSKTANFKPQSDSGLPLDIWSKIMKLLCDDVEIKGVRGPSVIARELCNLSMVNKELYSATLPAFQHLSTLCRPIQCLLPISSSYTTDESDLEEMEDTRVRVEDRLWESFVSDPASMTQAQLKSMCQATQLHSASTKATTALRLLRQIGIEQPTRIPARLLISVKKERKEILRDLPELYRRATSAPTTVTLMPVWIFGHKGYCAFDLRIKCVKAGLPTLKALRTGGFGASATSSILHAQ